MNKAPDKKPGRISRITERVISLWTFLRLGVWSDTRRTWWLNTLRTINLSVNSFLNRDIQTQACAMTFRTMLAIVPALALLLAIGRGFGMQSVLKDELYRLFPAQHTAISYSMNFVESYLDQASEGVFLGVGIAVLLWTLISLLGNVEDSFNLIWGVKTGRSIWRKATDYTALLLILPVLMLCASGISLLLSSTLRSVFDFDFMTPVISIILEGVQVLMTFLFFTAAYILIPNTKVKFANAFLSGTLAGSGFLILQWLFVTGTLYVTRYNAIYGSFAFIPLLLLWIQLVWVICLAGAVICYSSQNVFAFSLDREVSTISNRYLWAVTLAISAIITRRFLNGERPATARDFMNIYEIPARLVTDITDTLVKTGIANRVLLPDEKEVYGYQLAIDPATFTVEVLTRRIYTLGNAGFISDFDSNFPDIMPRIEEIEKCFSASASRMKIADIKIPELNTQTKPQL
ncbi:MAG: YihY/virulence factor BrkB family protein [Muribaculaceae bacterium]|nr:YihY/virulence factor BrkB family protein [Muribaculaceae bacterium]